MYPTNSDDVTLEYCELSDSEKEFFDKILSRQVKTSADDFDETEVAVTILPID